MSGSGSMKTIPVVLATGNPDKARELRPMLEQVSPLFSVHALSDLGITEEIEETETTLSGNALLKADGIFALLEQRFAFFITMADDTGLEVDALGGQPGVLSARFAPVPEGTKPSYEDNIRHLLLRMEGMEKRTARFRTVIAIKGRISSGGKAIGFRHTAEGVVEGFITKGKKGDQGFGYDPVFHVNSAGKTYSEMTIAEKNMISHRSLALRKASAKLFEIMSTHCSSGNQDIPPGI
ncbi:MAG: RdgB/HAM1 family non-canonical purine NTP pyrophosphatase [Chlorobium sp.]|nr:RdgB/HAM1 family non-canonical purine NTP pyrophosphatase [Chlorobium sp.]